MSTLEQLTGAAVVLATLQVMACVVPAVQEVLEDWLVTSNGPEVLVTVILTSALLTPPLPSRTVTR